MRGLMLAAVLLAGADVQASEPYSPLLDETSSYRRWSEVEAVLARADARDVRSYDAAGGGRWLLTDDGRLLMISEDGPSDARGAMLGHYRQDGHWLRFDVTAAAVDVDSMSTEDLADVLAMMEMTEAQLRGDAPLDVSMTTGSEDAQEGAQSEAEAGDEQAVETVDHEWNRYLRIPYGDGGELLVNAGTLKMAAKGWDGKGPLSLHPVAWRGVSKNTAGDAEHDDYGREFEIASPLSAGLPEELTRLLRRDAIQARVVEIQESAETLQWSHQRAEVHLVLAAGSNHGLYEDMDVYGLPPDESLFATLTHVEPERSIATLHIERFSPQDAVQLPVAGLRVTTRRDRPTACHFDSGVALRGKVLAASASAKTAAWDHEGYAWIEITLDQGSAQGVMAGDTFYAEGDGMDGEGRVRAVQSDRSTVLWRAQRYDEDQPMVLPASGAALVTPAWRRAEWETFGE